MIRMLLGIVVVVSVAAMASAQSLYLREPTVPVDEHGEPDPAATLDGYSLLYLEPPEPRTFAKHDLITIIIDESSNHKTEQKLKTDKSYDAKAKLTQFLDLNELARFQLANGIGTTPPEMLNISAEHEFDGKGKYERKERLQDRIQAEIIDIKPNGVLVLEARAYRDNNGQTQSLRLAGNCRQEDVTVNNTIMSSQIAGKVLIIENEGEVDKATRKGVIPRILETVFNF
jgi:flagellar L-ring protein precursor FlgH